MVPKQGQHERNKMNSNEIENEVIIIAHHVEDIEEGLQKNDITYVKNGLKDIRESLERIKKLLKPDQQSEIDRIANMME